MAILKPKYFIPASNEPSGCACTSIRRLPRGSNTPQLSCVTSLMPRQLAAGYLTWTHMDIESMLEFISRETPGHAKEIWSAIDLLSNTIENTKCAIDGFIGKLSSNREYDKASEYMKMSQNMAELLDMINQYTYTK